MAALSNDGLTTNMPIMGTNGTASLLCFTNGILRAVQ